MLPSGIRYRYTEVGSLVGNTPQHNNVEHVLFVARGDMTRVSAFSQQHRAKGYSVGLFLMADERNTLHYEQHYAKFDYVLRHYYFANHSMRALGNITCGLDSNASLPLPEIVNTTTLPPPKWTPPKWGVHWAFLPTIPGTGIQGINQRSPDSVWPISKRPVHCSFEGRKTKERKKKATSLLMQENNNITMQQLCHIQFIKDFKQGSVPFHYTNRLGQTKIGLNPVGNNPECHRLAEMMENGAVPAMKDANFIHAPFRTVPGIIGDTWEQVQAKIHRLLQEGTETGQYSTLEALQKNTTTWYHELKQCMTQDLGYIFRNSFEDAKERRK